MVIIGLGGLTKDILKDLLEQNKSDDLLFFTELENDTNIPFFVNAGLKVSCQTDELIRHFKKNDNRFLVLIGNNQMRESMVQKYKSIGGTPHYLISRSANVPLELCSISKVNTVIMHCAMLSAGAILSEGSIVNPYSYLGHDAIMGKYSFLGGYSGISRGTIGDYTFIGLKTVILPGRSVGNNSIIGAMSLVNKSIGDNKKAYGTPAKEYS